MKTIILIPARYASQRYPGKPLARLHLPSGEQKTLIELSWLAAKKVQNISAVYVVTDDSRIEKAAQDFGADVIMTTSQCLNGTQRCAIAVQNAGLEADLFINFQGDAPLTPPWFVEDLIKAMQHDPTAQMATPVLQMDQTTYRHFVHDRHHNRVGGTTVVFDQNNYALYFSKEVIPYIDISKFPVGADLPIYHHVGVYAYRPDVLSIYNHYPLGRLEMLEGLEQLRFLENECRVKCVLVDSRGKVFWELNNIEDVKRIEMILKDEQSNG